MRSAPAAVLLMALIALALAARLWGSGGDPEFLPTPPGLGLDRSAVSSTATLRAELLLPACPSPITYMAVPAHDVSIDPSLVVASVDRGRSVVVYGGLHIPDVFTAEIVDALYLARRLAQIVGLIRPSFGSNFVMRFTLPSGCEGVTGMHLAHIVNP